LEGDLVQKAVETLAALGGASVLRRVFGVKRDDLQICHTRIEREGVGLPWDKKLALHRMEDGSIEMTALKADD